MCGVRNFQKCEVGAFYSLFLVSCLCLVTLLVKSSQSDCKFALCRDMYIVTYHYECAWCLFLHVPQRPVYGKYGLKIQFVD